MTWLVNRPGVIVYSPCTLYHNLCRTQIYCVCSFPHV
jgi:hypothetical protein